MVFFPPLAAGSCRNMSNKQDSGEGAPAAYSMADLGASLPPGPGGAPHNPLQMHIYIFESVFR